MSWGQERFEAPLQYKVCDKWGWKCMKGREGYSWSNQVIEVEENEVLAETGAKNKLF